MNNQQFGLLIPVYDSDISQLDSYIADLAQYKNFTILLVDDGSTKECAAGLKEVADKYGCTLLTHRENRGKGAALKTGFAYFSNLIASGEGLNGVICVDSDGQHLVKDLLRIVKTAISAPDEIIFGARDFSWENVPFKSRFGNNLTTKVMALFYSLRLSDTQTGLRYIPASRLATMLEVKGERFEYETNMLIAIARCRIPYREIPIDTVYIDDNSGTHFRPLHDSLRIYKCIFSSFFRFLFSSVSSALIDFLLFTLVIFLVQDQMLPAKAILVATLAARVISSLYNYTFNRAVVFDSSRPVRTTMLYYYLLAIFILCASAYLVTFFWHLLGSVRNMQVCVKIVVDAVLFLFSFYVQKKVIFRPEAEKISMVEKEQI